MNPLSKNTGIVRSRNLTGNYCTANIVIKSGCWSHKKNLSDFLDQIEEEEFCLSEKTKYFAITFDKKEFTFGKVLCGLGSISSTFLRAKIPKAQKRWWNWPHVVQNVRRQIGKGRRECHKVKSKFCPEKIKPQILWIPLVCSSYCSTQRWTFHFGDLSLEIYEFKV